MIDWDLLLYAVLAGGVLGLILGATRPHMTGRATAVFTMLYYFLFTGFVNIQRWVSDGNPFDDNAFFGFTRAVLFGLGATIAVIGIRHVRKHMLEQYMEELEEKNLKSK